MAGNIISNSLKGEIKNFLKRIWDSKEFSDVTLVFDDQQWIKTHKVVLSACSSVFKNVFSNNDDEDETIIYLQGTQYQDMMVVLQYMYCGKAFDSYTNIKVLKEIALNLKIYQLMESITDYETESLETLFTPLSPKQKKETRVTCDMKEKKPVVEQETKYSSGSVSDVQAASIPYAGWVFQ